MKKLIAGGFAIAFLFLTLNTAYAADTDIIINEFSSNGSSDWVEFYNSGSESINLEGWKIQDRTGTELDGTATTTISGVTLPAGGFVSIDISGFNAGGDVVTLLNASSTEIDSVAYGSADNSDVAAPGTGEFAFRDSSGDWHLATFNTKGSANVEIAIGTDYYPTIQEAIDAATTTPGVVVNVGAGTYAEDVDVNKSLTLQGSLSAGEPTAIITGVVAVSASDVNLTNLKIDRGGAGTGLSLEGASLSNISIDGLTVTGALSNNAVSPFVGLRVGSGTSVSGLNVTNSHFDGNDIGWYLAKETAASAAAVVDDVLVTDTTFNNDLMKGIYAEKLSNAVFNGITVSNSGTKSDYGFNAGIDINLKWSDYSNIEIKNSTISASGLMGSASNTLFPVGITIKARSDGGYDSPPATLDGVTLNKVTVTGGVNSMRFGEPAKNNAGPTNVVVSDSTMSGMSGFALINETQATTTAMSNWWGTASSTEIAALISGSVTTDPWYVNSAMTVLSNEAVTPDDGGNVTVTDSAPNVVVNSDTQPITINADSISDATVVLGSLLASGTGSIPQITINSSAVNVEIPASTITSEDADWDGVLNLPTIVSAPSIETDEGTTATAVTAIEVGAGDTKLTFNQPVRLTFSGQAGNSVGWSRAGDFTAITDVCDSLASPSLDDGEDCKIASGADLVVWTKHFTTFVTYTQSSVAEQPSPARIGGQFAPSATITTTEVPAAAVQAGEVLGAALLFPSPMGIGYRGQEVLDLQVRLQAEGYFKANPTGYFGPITQEAVKAYQQMHSISATGFVGPLTLASLNSTSETASATPAVNPQIAVVKTQLISLIQQLISLLQAQMAAAAQAQN